VDRLLIVGASGRAAAASARRAGFEPFVLDLFADADTERLATVWKLPFDQYPHGFVELAKRVPPMPWMYTGGLENYPDVVAAISESRELWGNGPDVLKKVRDPIGLSEALKGQVLRPRLLTARQRPEGEARWLRKPIRGSGGGGIRFAHAEDFDECDSGSFLQEFLDGESISFTSFHKSPYPKAPIGISRQLIGVPWLHARDFQYCGNIGLHFPSKIDWGSVADAMCEIPRRLGVTGLWGADCIVHDGKAVLIEINPRYPASTELFEWRKEIGTLKAYASHDFHREGRMRPGPRLIGKAIYYAPHRIVFPASGPWDDSLARCADVWWRPDFADIPHADDIIEPGQPVLTIFAEAPDVTECEAKLKARAAELDRLFAVG
jgi:predicted ATP-grasp superfamily ATP-dependent carboligase